MRVLITGGSSDIAQEIAKRRLELGDEILVSCSTERSLKKTIEKYQAQDLKVEGFIYQFNSQSLDQNATKLLEQKPIDAVVLNAFSRVPTFRRIHEVAYPKAQKYINDNVMGNLWLMQYLLNQMVQQQFGRVVLISSVSATMGTSLYGVYCAAKAALEGLILNIAVDYGQDNILANIVRAGLFKTSRTKMFWSREAYQQKVSSIIPQGCMGEPEQLALSLDPLLAKNSYMTGSILTVSGGMPLINPKGLS